jgi:hypothetical protein
MANALVCLPAACKLEPSLAADKAHVGALNRGAAN